MELWELIARERVRQTMAVYNWAGDSGRAADLAETFTPDGVLELRHGGTYRTRAEIAAFIGGVANRPDPTPAAPVRRLVRHNLATIRFTSVTPEQVRVESYFTVFTEIGLDHYGRYRDLLVPVGDDWRIEHRLVSTDWTVPESSME